MKRIFQFSYQCVPLGSLDGTDKDLVDVAIRALEGSHSPYSGLAVGAALRLADGMVVMGANQEDVSYPCGTCAERSALNYAQTAAKDTPVEAIAIVARRHGSDRIENTISPCGLCRQALLEVERRQQSPIQVLMAGADEVVVVDSVADLLPLAF